MLIFYSFSREYCINDTLKKGSHNTFSAETDRNGPGLQLEKHHAR